MKKKIAKAKDIKDKCLDIVKMEPEPIKKPPDAELPPDPNKPVER